MFELKIKNMKTGEIFTKVFNSFYAKEKFANKCKYSKLVKIISESKLY